MISNAMLLLLHIALLQVFGSGATSVESSPSSISTPLTLTSSSLSSTIYSCFFVNNVETGLKSAKEACCESIVGVLQIYDNHDEDKGHTISLHHRCMSEIAQIPQSISLVTTKNPDDVAKFAWAVASKPSAELAVKSTLKEQYLWTTTIGGRNGHFQRDLVQTISPFHKTLRIQSPKQNASQSVPVISSKLKSHLSEDGGMHRLFHHSFQSFGGTSENGDYSTYFLYLTIPKGMFIDLDDPIEPTNGAIQSTTPTEITDGVASDASHNSFVVTTRTESKTTQESSVLSFRARLHAATICDIEQPSFVSGQHLIVWEIDSLSKSPDTATRPVTIEFATKLHLRYPHPSSTMEEWIDLPSPLLIAAPGSEATPSNDVMVDQEFDWDMGPTERVWVAAGKDEDHDWIMGMTVSFCFIGVAIMLRDISRVSLWDDV